MYGVNCHSVPSKCPFLCKCPLPICGGPVARVYIHVIHVCTLYVQMASLCKCSPCCLAREFQAPMGTYSGHYGTLYIHEYLYALYFWVVSMLHDLPFTVLTAEELQTFLTALFARVHVEALIHGNVSKQVNSTIFSKVSAHLRVSTHSPF